MIEQIRRDRLHDFAELRGAFSAEERFLDGRIVDKFDFEETLRHFLEMRLTQQLEKEIRPHSAVEMAVGDDAAIF